MTPEKYVQNIEPYYDEPTPAEWLATFFKRYQKRGVFDTGEVELPLYVQEIALAKAKEWRNR